MAMVDLSGKVAIVTGSTRGIGRAIARALAEAGATVGISGRTQKDVDEAVAALQAEGHRAVGRACDVRRYDDAKALVDHVAEAASGLDILVNNAGVGVFAPVFELDPEQWDQVIETNLSGVFYCSHAAIPHFEARGGGAIVNISSLAGKNAFQGGAAYNASKFGLEGLSEAMMLDLRYKHIKVAYVMPGSVATEFSGRGADEGQEWRLTSEDVAEVVMGILGQQRRALASRVELRPFQPPQKR